MVPSAYVPLGEMPMTATGKTDRRRLREMGQAMTVDELTALRKAAAGSRGKREPGTEAERRLRKVWARVLGVDAKRIGVDDSFFQLGGDSISAMQASSGARLLGITVSTADILRKRTIANLAVNLVIWDKSVVRTEASPDLILSPFPLSPIQELYTRTEGTVQTCFDQGFYLRMSRQVSLGTLSAALSTIVRRHAMLRSRFRAEGDGQWSQMITEDVEESLLLERALIGDTSSSGEALAAESIARCREKLDVQRGPMLSGVLLEGNEPQYLFLTIHHLVVDLVSWRVILHELESLLLSQALGDLAATTFQTWCARQADFAGQRATAPSYSGLDTNPTLVSYWGMQHLDNMTRDSVTHDFSLDGRATSALLGKSNEAFQTRPVELMLATLLHSFRNTFPDRPVPTVFSEGHGREEWSPELDVSSTVGWFTTLFPVQISEEQADSLESAVRCTKDAMRRLALNGMEYFATRFLTRNNAEEFAAKFPVEIVFNYQGLYQQLERKDGVFHIAPLPDGSDPDAVGFVRRLALVEVEVTVNRGCTSVSFTFNRQMRHQSKILGWMRQYQHAIEDAVLAFEDRDRELTLADFPRTFDDYGSLRIFQEKVLPGLGIRSPGDVDDVFSCSPMQEGILVNQAKQPDSYRCCFVFEVLPGSEDARVDAERLQLAWEAVVRRHPLLRALILDTLPGRSGPAQLILKDPSPSVSRIRRQGRTVTVDQFREQYDPVERQMTGLQHHLTICELDDGNTLCCLEMNHVIIDGYSSSIILRDIEAAYSGHLDPNVASYRQYVTHVDDQAQDESQEYWARLLSNVEPCHFPTSDASTWDRRAEPSEVRGLDYAKIHDFCAAHEITIATVLQTAWGLVLQKHTGAQDVCFGYLTSGREMPVDGIAEIVGPTIGMMTSKVSIEGTQDVIDTLRQVQEQTLSSLPHQAYPLAKVHRLLGLGSTRLFNTAISFQKATTGNSKQRREIVLREIAGYEETEVSYPSLRICIK